MNPPTPDFLYDEADEAIADVKVQTPDRAFLHQFVTWHDHMVDSGGPLTVYDGRTCAPVMVYAPGAWQHLEVLRYYREGDDPPEAET